MIHLSRPVGIPEDVRRHSGQPPDEIRPCLASPKDKGCGDVLTQRGSNSSGGGGGIAAHDARKEGSCAPRRVLRAMRIFSLFMRQACG